MRTSAPFLTRVGVAIMSLIGVLGLGFAAADAFADLETTQAIGTIAPWLVLVTSLSALAFLSLRFAPWALTLLTAFTIVFGIMEADAGQITTDDPFSGIWVLVLAVALGFLGLNHTRLAGGLLAALGAGQLVALFVDANRDGAGLADLLGSAAGSVVITILVVAALFLLDSRQQVPVEESRHADAAA